MATIWTDFSLDEDKKIISSDRFDFILQEISILFDTNPGEVLGDNTFGSNFEEFIWNLKISNTQISEYVKSIIMNQTLTGWYFDIDVDTNILYGTEHDIILVTISIRDPEYDVTQKITYKF